ncbi:hypothetical protein HOY82DRAFT_576318 [Tuber indicum]|nr:hypothetical protein HOY82DRAFT_576318 [Tuber indicum]
MAYTQLLRFPAPRAGKRKYTLPTQVHPLPKRVKRTYPIYSPSSNPILPHLQPKRQYPRTSPHLTLIRQITSRIHHLQKQSALESHVGAPHPNIWRPSEEEVTLESYRYPIRSNSAFQSWEILRAT